MRIGNFNPYAAMEQTSPLCSKKSKYNPLNPPAKIGDTLDISTEGLQKAQERFLKDKTIGLLGTPGVDVVYIPAAVLRNIPDAFNLARDRSNEITLADVANGIDPTSVPLSRRGIPSSEDNAAFGNLWSKYINVLKKYGIDHKDSDAFKEFLLNQELCGEVEEVFENSL